MNYAKNLNVTPKGVADPWLDLGIITEITRTGAIIDDAEPERIQRCAATVQKEIVDELLELRKACKLGCVHVKEPHRWPDILPSP